jgi:hypothetical protein
MKNRQIDKIKLRSLILLFVMIGFVFSGWYYMKDTEGIFIFKFLWFFIFGLAGGRLLYNLITGE